MATAGQTLVQLPQEDLQKLLDEVTALRQEVLFLRENPSPRGGKEGD
jgi:hypothetical protein